ncbi:MAG: MATE family efflux transporter [Oribacterium sp.]|nr:MATE family efflux transporter [Oribacterium sp.]MDY6317150.1 MATE family efflux transporter [Oribacterium sp.]
MEKDLTEGSVQKNLLVFSVPYLISCFLQTFYGLADLFITGQFNGAAPITAVSVGSQVMHMLTVMIVGLAMGATVLIGRYIGAKDRESAAKAIGNAVTIFLIVAAFLTAACLAGMDGIITALKTPAEAVSGTRDYLFVCFVGIPFIVAYNVISSIFRGIGDTKSPMIFVLIAGILNIVLDYIFIGPMLMGAKGAAIATVFSQAVSVCIALLELTKMKLGIALKPWDLLPERETVRAILSVGIPVALQDGFIQISFLIITAIANSRGVDVAAAVGIVEKIISFVFLVPSAMEASVTALTSQNAGAGKHERGEETLRTALVFCSVYAVVMIVVAELLAEPIVHVFTDKSEAVVTLGAQYLRTYIFDVFFAGFHFCLSGYFCAYNEAIYSFIHNICAILLVRIPGAILATRLFPMTLYALGLAAPCGSLLSTLICLSLLRRGKRLGYWH